MGWIRLGGSEARPGLLNNPFHEGPRRVENGGTYTHSSGDLQVLS